jgi:4-alpha-glucanotransferase
MEKQRYSGVLLHPVSLPGEHGIGDLGEYAYRFVDFLVKTGASLWQVLPLGPTGSGNSPYTSLSSFAGNPLLISPNLLVEEGLLQRGDLDGLPEFPSGRIDYDAVASWKVPLLRRAAENFLSRKKSGPGAPKASAAPPDAGMNSADFADFCRREAYWLDDFALFTAAKECFEKKAAEETAEEAAEAEKVLQYFFDRQWRRLKRYAEKRGIVLFGDLPIFVAGDSADVWAHPELFLLDEKHNPEVVAGVPPDYFSATGQRWGNPLYDWEAHEAEGFTWWISRIERVLELTAMLRIDHFRGFESCWEIPAEEPTAVNGRWVKAPGEAFFSTLMARLGEGPEIVAENLGVITPEVEALRRKFRLPGMAVLHFAFEPDGRGGLKTDNPFLPHNLSEDTAAYTGTHDNDTTAGWYGTRSEVEKDLIRRYLGRPDDGMVWELIREVYRSVARYAVVPMQDILELGPEARMNTPSTVGANWAWRMDPEDLAAAADRADRLREYASLYGRLPPRDL